ncbi:MAG: hypothetical protein AB7U07_00025 [Thermoleophilia bacterium]
MTVPIHLALVVEAPQIPTRTVMEIAAALQRQLIRDVAPIWGVYATLDAFASLEDVPPGYWPILVGDHFPGVEPLGVHQDHNGQPFALVEASRSWSLTASHEVIEMVIDPWGNRTVPGGSPMAGQGLVEIIVEVCDPPGDAQWAYTDNGYLRSDFVTPAYYDPVGAPGVRYSFTGAVTSPREILDGGYMSWRDPASGEWWQGIRTGGRDLVFRNIGRLDEDGRPMRERIDQFTPMTQLFTGTSDTDPALVNARERLGSTHDAARAKAEAVRGRMRDLGLI